MTTLAELIVQETQAAFMSRALTLAATVGLNTTAWETGGVSRTLFQTVAYELSQLEVIGARYVASKFLDLAAALTDTKWLKLAALQQYGYTAREASYATCTERLTNASGNVYTIDALDLVFAQTGDSSVTYRNTSGGTLNPGSTLDVDIACEIAGSSGSASIGDIDIVTSLLGVTASNTTAAVGIDEESPSSIVAGCRNKLESLSPNGAAGAYAYVALNTDLTGADDVTRVRVEGDSTTGDVSIYLASSSGAVSAGDRTAVEDAIVTWCTPLCVTPTVASASAYSIAVVATVKIYSTVGVTTGDAESAIESSLDAAFAVSPVGGDGDDGKIYRARLIDAIVQTYPGYVFDVQMSSPASDVSLSSSQVATPGSHTITVTLEDPA
jgi:hypothetical protein